MRTKPFLALGCVGVVVVVSAAACGTTSSAPATANDDAGTAATGSSGASGSSGATSSSGNAASSSGGSSSGPGTGAGSSSGGKGSSSSSGGTSSGGTADGGSDAGDDGSIPNGIPSAGTCAAMPVITGGALITKLLAIADQAKCTGANIVSQHSYNQEGGGNGTANICKANGAVYYQSGMNIDCDGLADSCTPQHCPSDDPTNQAQTSFSDANGKFLSAGLTPYVVIPSDFNYPGLDTNNGGNVIAVIYDNKLEFAVFGDTGPTSIIGEASYATGNDLGIPPDPASGGTQGPVTYIVFVGSGVAPADLSNPLETWQLGMMLAQQLIANNP